MTKRFSDAEVMGAAIGALVAIAAAGVLGAVRGEIDQANAALILVLVVVLGAFTGGRRAGAFTALVAAVSFDFFLTRPYGSLAIKSHDDIVTTVLLLAVGVAVGQIAADRREARAAGRAGADEVAGIYRVAGLTADGVATDQVVRAVEEEVAGVLRLRDCHLEALPLDPPLPELEPSGRIEAPYVFEGEGFTLPADGFTIALRTDDRRVGWLVCRPADGTVGISRDRRRTALVLADHLALTLAARSGSDVG